MSLALLGVALTAPQRPRVAVDGMPVGQAYPRLDPLRRALPKDAKAQFDREVGRERPRTLGTHTEAALGQHARWFAHQQPPPGLSRRLMPNTLMLHDIGKPGAIAAGDRDLQHAFTVELIQSLRPHLSLPHREVQVALALIDGDPLGLYLWRRIELPEAKRQVTAMAAESGLPPARFFRLLTAYFQSDMSSYTHHAGSTNAADHYFVTQRGRLKFDPERERLRFRRAAELRFRALERLFVR